jgi:hypothetical protein
MNRVRENLFLEPLSPCGPGPELKSGFVKIRVNSWLPRLL